VLEVVFGTKGVFEVVFEVVFEMAFQVASILVRGAESDDSFFSNSLSVCVSSIVTLLLFPSNR
jgi:hypothetical protein